MRSTRTLKRGAIALVKKGTKTVVSIAELYDCEGPFAIDDLKNFEDLHGIPKAIIDCPEYKWRFAWKLKNVQRLKCPVPYQHRKGSTVWVTLDEEARKQISSSVLSIN